MATLSNTTSKKSDFDWDEINVGDCNLDHSENFFAGPSNKANTLGDALNFQQDMDSFNNTSHKSADFDWNEIKAGDHSEQLYEAASANKENIPVTLNCNSVPAQDVLRLEGKREILLNESKGNACNQNLDKTDELNATHELKLQLQPDSPPFATAARQVKQEINENDEVNGLLDLSTNIQLEWTPVSVLDESSVKQEMGDHSDVKEPLEVRPKLKLNWTPMPGRPVDGPGAAASAAIVARAPRAYECKDVYQAKREMALRQREDEERKAREFHSKPVPNFKAMHKRLAETIVIHRITVPVTPETIKHSYAHMERRKQRELESKKCEHQSQGVRALLHEAKPFQLRADQRVRERREYDNVVQCNLEEKKKQQEEQRKQRELEEKKELRKLTEFKARPNPFK